MFFLRFFAIINNKFFCCQQNFLLFFNCCTFIMKTFAQRLLAAINKIGISQTEAARRCGISQQSMHYIISKNLETSKLAAKIAHGLDVNPDWLIYGEGSFQDQKVYQVPIIKTAKELQLFLCDGLDLNSVSYAYTDTDLGEKPFAYLQEPNKMAICCTNKPELSSNLGYLCLKNDTIVFLNIPKNKYFLVFEWRNRCVSFEERQG